MRNHFVEDLNALVGDALSNFEPGSIERDDVRDSLCDHLALTVIMQAEGNLKRAGAIADQMIERLHRGMAVMHKAQPATLEKMRAEIRAMQNLVGEN